MRVRLYNCRSMQDLSISSILDIRFNSAIYSNSVMAFYIPSDVDVYVQMMFKLGHI